MQSFSDKTKLVEGRNSERMNFRTKPAIKATIKQAAALSGVDDSTFTMSAALREAERVIGAHEQTLLHAVDHETFFAAMEATSAPGEKLAEASERYKSRTVSK